MKYGTRELDGATCKVLKPASLPMHMHRDVREITHLRVPEDKRRQGLATKLLESICKEADKFKMILILTADPGDDPVMTKEQLANWYGSTFDFNVIQESPLIMARMFAVYFSPKKQLIEAVSAAHNQG